MPLYSSLYDLFSEPQIALYFAVLLWAAAGCARRSERVLPLVAVRCHVENTLRPAGSPEAPLSARASLRLPQSMASHSFGPPRACFSSQAAATLSVTWAYIVRYTVAYEGPNLFDDAYKDVLAPPHFGTSAQLLTWVVVPAYADTSCLGSAPARLLCLLRARLAALGSAALPGRRRPTGRPATASGARAIRLQSRRFSPPLTMQVAAAWARDASPCYMLFGELGAMSAAFMTWIPLKTPSARRVPLTIVITSALALVAIANLAPADPDLWSGSREPPPARAGPLTHLAQQLRQHLWCSWRSCAAAATPPPLPSGPVFGDDFGSWLQLLHLLLLLPMPLAQLLPAQPSVEAAPFYAALGLAAAAWHLLGQP